MKGKTCIIGENKFSGGKNSPNSSLGKKITQKYLEGNDEGADSPSLR